MEQKTPTQIEEERKQLLAKGEISLWIDNYDDIFSDFDPRSYSQRALSDDFLIEAKKAVREAKGVLILRFLVPTSVRNNQQESMIRRRLREHFRKHHDNAEREMRGLVRNGILLALGGFALMLAAAFIAHAQRESFLSIFLTVLFEPAGWFMVWYGMDKIFYTAKEKRTELDFYQKMSKVDIDFDSY